MSTRNRLLPYGRETLMTWPQLTLGWVCVSRPSWSGDDYLPVRTLRLQLLERCRYMGLVELIAPRFSGGGDEP